MKKNLLLLVLATIATPAPCSMKKESSKKALAPKECPEMVIPPFMLPEALISLPKAPRFFSFDKQRQVTAGHVAAYIYKENRALELLSLQASSDKAFNELMEQTPQEVMALKITIATKEALEGNEDLARRGRLYSSLYKNPFTDLKVMVLIGDYAGLTSKEQAQTQQAQVKQLKTAAGQKAQASNTKQSKKASKNRR